MMEIENEKRLWDGENSFKGSRMHQRQRIPQVILLFSQEITPKQNGWFQTLFLRNPKNQNFRIFFYEIVQNRKWTRKIFFESSVTKNRQKIRKVGFFGFLRNKFWNKPIRKYNMDSWTWLNINGRTSGGASGGPNWHQSVIFLGQNENIIGGCRPRN